MIDLIQTDISHAQQEVSVDGELYWGILLGVIFASVLWYFVLYSHKHNSDNKLTLLLWQ